MTNYKCSYFDKCEGRCTMTSELADWYERYGYKPTGKPIQPCPFLWSVSPTWVEAKQ